jgi:hypothetical protein
LRYDIGLENSTKRRSIGAGRDEIRSDEWIAGGSAAATGGDMRDVKFAIFV